jgi:predicted nucleotidyltransferase
VLPSQLPDPELVKAFNHTVRRHFAAQIAREREEAEVRRGAVVPLVRQAVARARAEGRCERVWLFGSYAWGEPGDRSDVDILVEGCADSIALASLIGRACERDVHVIDGADALDSLRGRVSAEGLPL